VVTYFTRKNVL